MAPRGPTRKRTSAAKTSTCFEPDGLLQAQVSLQLHHDHRSTLLPGCDTGRSFNGPLQGRLRRPRAHVASIDGPRHLTRSGRSHYAAHPYNSGRCHRLGLPALLGWPQSRDPAPRRDGRHRPWLSARISSIRRCCRTRRRRDLNCIRDASACGRTKRHARADEGGRDVGIVLGSRLRVHQHDRPRRWTALPSLRPAPTARPRRFVGTGAVLFAAVNWINPRWPEARLARRACGPLTSDTALSTFLTPDTHGAFGRLWSDKALGRRAILRRFSPAGHP